MCQYAEGSVNPPHQSSFVTITCLHCIHQSYAPIQQDLSLSSPPYTIIHIHPYTIVHTDTLTHPHTPSLTLKHTHTHTHTPGYPSTSWEGAAGERHAGLLPDDKRRIHPCLRHAQKIQVRTGTVAPLRITDFYSISYASYYDDVFYMDRMCCVHRGLFVVL